jgi:hypothetical protein
MTTSVLLPETDRGTITFELTRSAGRKDELAITGHIEGYGKVGTLFPDTFEITGDVRGVLNCATRQLANGQFLSSGNSTPVVLGTFGGVYSDSPPSFKGTWMTNELLYVSSGNWSAIAVPR